MKIGILGWARLFASAIATGTSATVYRGTNKRTHFSGPRPTDARWWHDINVPAQANRQMNAQLRRDRRAEKLERNTMTSSYNNPCLNARISNLNPFYVAK